ncbi:MAG: M1 family metallopeptidase [Bacteroidetes bacterium]|nr:M1 family metallopeptidase [Bacteroidota bacterium]MBS1671687.1 M1 family metallopeptidase [Bacteroidota bacterium]
MLSLFPQKSTPFILFFILVTAFTTHAQLGVNKNKFTHADTLRGSLNPNRDWWNVLRYDITVKPDYETKTIEGKVIITCEAINKGKTLQIDLQQPLIIDSIINSGTFFSNKGTTIHVHKVYKFTQTPTDNIAIVELNETKDKGEKFSFHIYYHGKPREAIRPPWDGGWIWKKDEKGRPWMSVAVQGTGASAWYPCKDYQGDEPDNGASLSIIVPDTLVAVGNGRLKSKSPIPNSNLMLYRWEVKNPINNYNIIPYIGKYVNFTDTLMGLKGKLDLSYWVLDYNLEKAKEQFKQAKLMLRAFEYWFGPYPFYEDSYKLVDAPHLGMEHQSAVAYGNKYQNGYLGRDLSGTGWGLKWDFIIVHESGHEWFANNITSKDIADMWIHEGFTNYSETLFTEYYYGKDAATDYNVGTRRSIRNDIPIIGPYGVNKEGSGDMYPKSGNMLHSIRHAIDNDEKFRQILIGLNKTFYHQTVTTQQIESHISKQAGFDFSKVFNQYLRTTQIPILEFYKDSIAQTVTLHYTNCIEDFNLPIVISPTHKKIIPTEKWQTIKLNTEEIEWFLKQNIERMFYIKTKQLETKP